MALIVEDGTGLADAESFISVADATAYHAARGNDAWAALASDAEREKYLRRATDYMEEVYRDMWAGYRRTVTQALCWPRYMVPIKDSPGGYASLPSYYPDDSVPKLVARACAALALKAITGDLEPDLDAQVKRKSVGPLDVEYYEKPMQPKRPRAVDEMLQPFFLMDGLNISLVRG
jgi:hypothetical protein